MEYFKGIFSENKPKMFKELLIKQIKAIEKMKKSNELFQFYKQTFHWWLFPINESSLIYEEKYQLDKNTLAKLKNDKEYMENYLRGLILCFGLWGWNIKEVKIDQTLYDEVPKYYRDLNLYKAIISTGLFGLDEERESLIRFAATIIENLGARSYTNQYTEYLRSIVNSMKSYQKENSMSSISENEIEADENKIRDIKESIEKAVAKMSSWLEKDKFYKFYESYFDPWLFPSDAACPIHGERFQLDQVHLRKLNEDVEFTNSLKQGCLLAMKFWGWNLETSQSLKIDSVNRTLQKNLFKTRNSVKRALYSFEKLFPSAFSKQIIESLTELEKSLNTLDYESEHKKTEESRSYKQTPHRADKLETDSLMIIECLEEQKAVQFILDFLSHHFTEISALRDHYELEDYLDKDENKWLRTMKNLNIWILGNENVTLNSTDLSELKKDNTYIESLLRLLRLLSIRFWRWDIEKKAFLYPPTYFDFKINSMLYLFWLSKTCEAMDLKEFFNSMISLGYNVIRDKRGDSLNKVPAIRTYFLQEYEVLKSLDDSIRKVSLIKEKNLSQKQSFQHWRTSKMWWYFHESHYDWWTFPIDEISSQYQDRYRLDEVVREKLLNDSEFLESLKYCLESVALSWGWDIKGARELEHCGHDQKWKYWAVRLYKATKSAKLFNLNKEFDSLVRYAIQLLKNGHSLKYMEKDYMPDFIKWAEELKIFVQN